jgi:hypothetical protein
MSKHIKVSVEGYGTYQIPLEAINELLSFLNNKEAVSIKLNNHVYEVSNNTYTGRILLQE